MLKRSPDNRFDPATKVDGGADWASPAPSRGSLEKDVFGSVPKTMKRKAERLLQRLQQNPELKWNDQGETEFQGQRVKISNLVELVNDVLRKRKKL